MRKLSLSTKTFFSFIALILCSVIAVTGISHTTHAISATDFNAGNIIDDSVFYNKDAMSVSQIQSFLNSQIPSCDVWGAGRSGHGNLTRAQYAQQIMGWPGPPYVCLTQYYENPNTGETSYEKGGGAFTGGISAAQIIYNAAQQYGINPQVLLVMLKKESAGPLTADNWPLKSQYKYSMGYGCPDSGPNYSANCSAQKAGFYNQMMTAAWQLNYYKNHPNDYRYYIGQNKIQYSPDPNCGTKSVNIQNIATLSLYIYTPYTPNDAALRNYPGTASCGAYGNRNFFMFFSEWFGSTHGKFQIDMTAANQAITSTYQKYKSQLGTPISDMVPEYNTDGRVWQSFSNGVIIWIASNGAYPVFYGPLYDRWKVLGGSTGALGTPTNRQVTESDGRLWQSFSDGIIIWGKSTGAWEVVPGPINDKWRSIGGSTGALGKPVSSVTVNSSMRYQQFENGAIVRKDTTSPAFIITSAIYSKWIDNTSKMKTPTSDTTTESDGRIWQNFKNGTAVISSNQAYFVQFGPINDSWRSTGGSTGKLGKPTSDSTTESDGRIWQNFEKGQIIQHNNSSSAYPVLYGDIYNKWRNLGGSLGVLGTPTSEVTTESDGRQWQSFKNGTVIYSKATGAWSVSGNFLTYWQQNGGSTGKLGKPISDKKLNQDGTMQQEFEHGTIHWNPTIFFSFTIK